VDGDPFSPVLGAPQEVGEVVLGVGDCHSGHTSIIAGAPALAPISPRR
jgi:hypothetical protein